MSKIEKRHNSRLLVVLGISLHDLVNSSVVFSSEIEGSVDIVIRLIIMLYNYNNQLLNVLLVEYDQRACNEQKSRELQKPNNNHTKGAAFMAEPIYLGIAERVRSILN